MAKLSSTGTCSCGDGDCQLCFPKRQTFSGKGPCLSFEQCQNAMRAENINKELDQGRRVFGDDGPDVEGTWYEIDEALEPHGNGITVRTTTGKLMRIYSRDSSDKRAQIFDSQ